MAAEDWDHGDPMWEASYFIAREVEAFRSIRALTKGVRSRRRTKQIARGRLITKAFKFFTATTDPHGESGEWKLFFKEEQAVPETPDRLGRKKLIIARHVLSVVQVIGDEEFLADTHTRQQFDLWEERGQKLVVPADPKELLIPDLYPDLLLQTEYLGWIEAAQASANSA